MATALKIVATPIGNIRDISLRALDEIRAADVIFAEDTRHSAHLFNALNISLKPHCRLISCDSRKERLRIDVVIENLQANKQVILVSDAGCPSISDPGSLLIKGVIERGFLVEVIPGPSAITAAVMGAGIDVTRFAFLGFLPQKKSARHSMVIDAYKAGLALIIYESPVRVQALLDELFSYLGSKPVVVARELTKIYETFHRGSLGESLAPLLIEKGECVVLVGASDVAMDILYHDDDIKSFIVAKLQQGTTPKDIARMVSLQFNMKKTDAYQKVLEFNGHSKP